MANGLVAAVTVGCALAGSIAVSVLATSDLPRDELAPPAVGERVTEPAPPPRAAPRRVARPAAASQDVVPHPRPAPLDRGR